jgi:uncharacterized protein (TIGR00730 family)
MAESAARRPTTADEEIIHAEWPSVVAERSDEERLAGIEREFRRGFEMLADVGPAVCVFGSARTQPEDPEYAVGRELGNALAEAGFAVITGGGPGLMEAANRGAREAGGLSVGLNIQLPHEQALNPYCDIGIEFEHFFVRKLMFVRFTDALVSLPGGYGTLDETFEALTLIQTGKAADHPVILCGDSYWASLAGWIEDHLLEPGRISPEDFRQFELAEDVPGIMDRLCVAICA